MKYIKLSEGSVVVAEVQPISSWIDEANNRSFVGEGYVEINDDASFLRQKYDPSAESDPIKTSASFTEAGIDANGRSRWFDETTGDLMQYTYDAEGDITGSEVVS